MSQANDGIRVLVIDVDGTATERTVASVKGYQELIGCDSTHYSSLHNISTVQCVISNNFLFNPVQLPINNAFMNDPELLKLFFERFQPNSRLQIRGPVVLVGNGNHKGFLTDLDPSITVHNWRQSLHDENCRNQTVNQN